MINSKIIQSSWLKRSLEILPGLASWSALILPPLLSRPFPAGVVAFVILFDLYWLYRALIMTTHLILGYRFHRRSMQTDWLAKVQALPNHQELYHAIIVATYKEDISILRQTFQAIANSRYDLKKFIVYLAVEERDKERGLANARALKQEFGSLFSHFAYTLHPANIPDEVIGKGGNITFAGRELQSYLDQQQISYDQVVVTTLDADNRVDPRYFAELSYQFLNHPKPKQVSFQPIPMFFNNIWQAPVYSRLLAHGTMFWVMIEATRPWRLRNFSSHSQSMAALVEIDFWSTTTIVEDGHQYWRSYFAYDGDYSVYPLGTPIYQDAVVGENFFDTLRELYLQRRRWTWGCSDLPYIITNCLKNTSIPWYEKWGKAFRAFESHFSWATQAIYVMVAGWVPIALNANFSDTVLAYNFPQVASRLLTLAMVGLISAVCVATLLLPPLANRRQQQKLLLIEWLLIPIVSPFTSLLFGAIPALDSQTRLMLGKYLEFRVTKKLPSRN